MRSGGQVLAMALWIAATAAAGGAEPPAKVLAQVSADLNGDGVPDRAALLARDEDVDLVVTLSANGALPARPTITKPAFGWTGTMAGTEPGLSVNARGSLVVAFHNEAVGRGRWSQQVTIAYRNDQLVVAGYTYAEHDTLDPNAGGNCDVNFLSGKATRNGKPAATGLKPVPLTDWNEGQVPAACSF